MIARKVFTGLVIAAAFAVATSPRAAAQDGGARDPQATLDRYEKYLDRKPYADFAFDKLVEAAVQQNQLKELVGHYEERLAEGPDDRAAQVVLGRLYARTDQFAEALAVLEGIEEPDAELYALLGQLHLRGNDPAAATEALERAAAATTDRKLLADIHRRRGEAFLAAGDREAAARAFRDTAELEPESFNARLEVASLMAQHGLHEEAVQQFQVAEELASGDVPRRCQVLSEIGRLHEQRLQIPEALEVYRRAMELMGRGNWLKRDLTERIISIHRRSGTLDELVARARADAEGSPQDLDAREFLARALREAGNEEEARGVLAAAVADFPDDLKLSRGLIAVLEELEDTEAVIAEYQRVLTRRPEELELYLELGRVFAREGRWEQAKLQWQRTLEQRLDDAGLCLRLAGMYVYYDQLDEAVAMYEKAIELEPREIGHYAELAGFLAVRERSGEIPALLERAAAAAAGDSPRLEQLAHLWREYDEPERALASLDQAIAGRPRDARLLSQRADLLVQLDRAEEAVAALHEVINVAPDAALRSSSVDRVIRLFRAQDRIPLLLETEARAVAEGTRDPAPYLILGEAHAQEREPDLAIGYLEQLLELGGHGEDARPLLARLYEDLGDYGRALEQYEALVEEVPQSRRVHLREIARIHLTLYDQEKAFACYEEILRSSPDNAAAFKEVADAYLKLNLYERAAECLQQAVRLKPEDGRYHLQLAGVYRDTGEPDRARQEILAAVRSTEEEVREDAREDYYQLLSEEGQIDEEIASLRRSIDENPYDVESPLTLCDIYIRELEYELALELLERLLNYQPREVRLLESRARILGLMDRHDEAIADYETLWKLPGSDQERLALRIAEASIQAGDLERAREVTGPLRDALRVSRLYRKHDLFDEAVAVLERGVAQTPTDSKLYARLAQLLERMGRREEAAEHYERVLALEGDSWRTITSLGDLYFEMGRREEAVEYGRRLFSMTRLPEEEDDDGEDEPSGRIVFTSRSSSYRGASGWGGAAYSQVLDRIETYFQEKNLDEEFAAIGRAEIALQPTNTHLLDSIYYNLLYQQEDPGQAYELVREARELAVASPRVPPGSSRSEWLDGLDRKLISCCARDPGVGAERADELRAVIAAGAGTERDYVELAEIAFDIRAEEEAEEVLRAGLERFPDSSRLLCGLAQRAFQVEDYGTAYEGYERLVQLLDERSDAAELEERRRRTFEQQKRNLLQQFPFTVRGQVTDADLERLYELTRGRSRSLSWGIGGRMVPEGARARLASCLVKLDRRAEAKRVLESLAPAEPEDPQGLQTWIWLGIQYYELELYRDAEPVYERLRRIEETLERDPVLGLNRSWARGLTGPLQNLGRLYERRGDVLGAYDLLRTYGNAGAAELLLAENRAYGRAEERYRAELAEAEVALAESDDPFRRADYRDAGVKLAEILQYQKRWEDVLAVYRELVERLPDDFKLREVIARLHERADRPEEAVDAHYAIVERKRELNRVLNRVPRSEPRTLDPVLPPKPSGGSESWIWNNLSYSRGGFRGGRSRHSVNENYAAILRIYLDRRMTSKAAEVMRKLAREDVTTFRWLGWSLGRLIENYQLGAEGISILRLLHSYNPDDQNLALQYGKALFEAGKYEEAERIYTNLVNRTSVSSYYRQRAGDQLERVEKKLGTYSSETIEELRIAAGEDPKNVKVRTRLARSLFRDRDYEAALQEALVAEELAPHLDDVSSLVLDCLRVLGRHGELLERLQRRRDLAADEEERFLLAVELADHHYASGDRAAADAVLSEVLQRSLNGLAEYSPSAWYMEKGLYAEALVLLDQELEGSGMDSWFEDEVKARQARLHLLEGSPASLLESGWEKLEEVEALGGGSDQQRISTSVGNLTEEDALIAEKGSLLFQLGEEEEARLLWDELFNEHRNETRRLQSQLYREHGLYEDAIDAYRAYLDRKGSDTYHDVKTLAELWLQVEAYDEAIELLRRAFILASNNESQRQAVRKQIATAYRNTGRLAEYLDELAAESAGDPDDIELLRLISELATELGREEEAIAALEAVASKPGFEADSLPPLADRYQAAGDLERAAEALERLIGGNLSEYERRRHAERLAGLYVELGRTEDALDALRRGQDDPESPASLRQVADFFTTRDRYAEALPFFEEALAVDPEDAATHSRIARTYRELGRHAEALDHTFRYLSEPGSVDSLRGYGVNVLELADAAGEDDRLEAALAESPEDPELQFRAALLDLYRRRLDRSIERFEALLAARPDDLPAAAGLAEACLAAERYDEAFGHLERLRELYEREIVVDRSFEYRLQSLHTRIGALQLELSGVEAAVRVWETPAIRRNREVHSYRYTYYNEPESQRAELGRLYKRYRLYGRAAPALLEAQLVGGGYQGQRDREHYAWTLFYLGERERALELTWNAFLDPGGGLVPDMSSGPFYFPRDGEGLSQEGYLLVRLHRADGRMDELYERARELVAQNPEDGKARELLKYVLSSEERHGELLELIEEDLVEKPQDQRLLSARSRCLIELGRTEEAVAVLEKLLNRELGSGLAGPRTVTYSSSSGTSSSGAVRFQWSGGGSGGIGTSYSYTTYTSGFGQTGSRERRDLMALYLKLGRREDALRLEEEELNLGVAADRYSQQSPSSRYLELAGVYAEHDLDAEFERMCALALEADPEEYAESVTSRRLAYYRRRGLEEPYRRALAERFDQYAADIAEHPYSTSPLLGRAELQVSCGGDLAQARADAERALALDPRSYRPHAVLGWIALRSGAPEEAREHFERADRQVVLAGDEWIHDVRYGLGLALAAADRGAEAAPILQLALALDPENEAADEARAVLP